MRRTLPAVWHWVQNNQQTHHVSWPTAVAQTSSNRRDRKSTRLNSSHLVISYAVFCLKKKQHRFEIVAQPLEQRAAPCIPERLHGFEQDDVARRLLDSCVGASVSSQRGHDPTYVRGDG